MISLRTRPLVGAAAVLGLFLAAFGWLDYRAVSRELQAVVRSEAGALHGAVAAAARAQHAAAEHAETSLRERLLETARMLRELDRRAPLTPALIDDLVGPQPSYRVMLFAADGRREHVAGERAPGQLLAEHTGNAAGPGGRGRGRWGGPPPGAGNVAQRLLSGEAQEISTLPHTARDGHQRVAAGVRRTGGGVIVLNAATGIAQQLDEIYSLASLLAQIARATPALAYIFLDDAGRRVAAGPLASAAPEPGGTADTERIVRIAEVFVLERRTAVDLGDDRSGLLRIGMRLDEVSSGERRTLARVSLGALTAFGFLMVALAFGSLRERYGALSEEHARAQDALRRRDRLAAMGEMASTVAHEIRNPLNAIAMSAQRLVREYPPPADLGEREELRDLLDVIQRESSRINSTVQQFLEFARPRPLNRRHVNVEDLIEQTAGASRSYGAPRGVSVNSRCEPGLHAWIDPDQLKQALDNLLRNAIDASPDRGTVLLEARGKGRAANLIIADRGAGIPADVLPRIFDLYFTTKPEGTGIGLAVAQQIVTAHGGTIEVDSAPARGTRMIVRLPEEEAGTRG